MSLLTPGSGAPLPSACFYDANQQGQVTLSDGYYKFDLNFADPACPSGAAYLLSVTPPSTALRRGSVGDHSAAVVRRRQPRSPCRRARRPIDDAVPATAQHCEATPSEFQPPPSAAPRTAGTFITCT